MKTPRGHVFTKEAGIERRNRLRRQRFTGAWATASSKKRWDRFGIVVAVVAALTIGPAWALDKTVRLWWRPHDPAVLMWWVEPGPWIRVLVSAGVLLALILGLAALTRENRPLPRWPFLILPLAWLAALPLATRVHTFVYADRIVMTGEAGAAPRTLMLGQASSIQTGCISLRGGRGERSVASVDYIIDFGNQGAVDLGAGVRERSAAAVGDWLKVVGGLDRSLIAKGVPRVIMTGEDGYPRTRPMCLRALMAEQDAAGFRNARQLLAIGDADLYRNGLVPGSLW